jgi:hypothetical protein
MQETRRSLKQHGGKLSSKNVLMTYATAHHKMHEYKRIISIFKVTEHPNHRDRDRELIVIIIIQEMTSSFEAEAANGDSHTAATSHSISLIRPSLRSAAAWVP